MKKEFFPLYFKLAERKILLVGGGEVAERKVKQLLKFESSITVISPETSGFLASAALAGDIEWIKRNYISPEAEDYSLVIAATGDMEINRQVFSDAVKNNIPVNVVDIPELCTVYFPAVIERGNITLAIGSDGKAPFYTRAVREFMEFIVPQNIEKKSLIAAKFREFVMEKCAGNFKLKNEMYEKFLMSIDSEVDRWSAENPPFDEWSEWLEEDV